MLTPSLSHLSSVLGHNFDAQVDFEFETRDNLMYLLLCFSFFFFSDCSPVSSPARPCHCTKECHTSKNRREFQSGFWLRMHLFKLQYYVFGTGLGIFRLLCNLKSDCFDCVKFGSVCVKTSRPYSDSTFFGCLSKGFWVVSDYFITTSRLSKSREKSDFFFFCLF